MSDDVVSRRSVIVAGACALVGVSAPSSRDQLIRAYYAAWEKKDWSVLDGVLAESFTFTSANDDDHISKATFKARCWSGQVELIQRFELETVVARETDAFIKYLCHTTKGTAFRNVEYWRFAGDRVGAIECYFGAHAGYPSAAATGKS